MQKMFCLLKTLACLCLIILTTKAARADHVYLTGLMLFSCDEAGNPAGDFVWDNRGLDSDFYKVWIADAESSHFLNGPSWADAPVSLALKPGENDYILVFQANGPWDSSFGINLFFDGSTVPAISVKTPLRTGAVIPAFSINNARSSYSLTSYPFPNVPAAGSSTAALARPIELTEFSVAAPGLFNVDLVGTHQIGSNGAPDFVATLTLGAGPKNEK